MQKSAVKGSTIDRIMNNNSDSHKPTRNKDSKFFIDDKHKYFNTIDTHPIKDLEINEDDEIESVTAKVVVHSFEKHRSTSKLELKVGNNTTIIE